MKVNCHLLVVVVVVEEKIINDFFYEILFSHIEIFRGFSRRRKNFFDYEDFLKTYLRIFETRYRSLNDGFNTLKKLQIKVLFG